MAGLLEFVARFGVEERCIEHLAGLRWPGGFACAGCGGRQAWRLKARPRVYECAACHRQESVTAGTVLHRTRTGLCKWFLAAYLMGRDKRGVSAKFLQRELGVAYQTAWTMAHKLRHGLSEDPSRPLHGFLEADETFIGGRGDPTSPGRSTANPDKSLVVAAVEKAPAPKNKKGKHGHAVKRQHGFFAGNARIAVLPAATGAELGAFLKANVETRSHLLTDGFAGYRGRDAALGEHLKHTPVIQDEGANAGEFFPITIGDLAVIEPLHVAAYIKTLKVSAAGKPAVKERDASRPTVKQHLAAIRMLFDWLVVGQVVTINPAHAVRAPKHIVRRSKTPVLVEEQARRLLASIKTVRKTKLPDGTEVEQPWVVGLRDRALIGVMTYSFARISAVVGMRVEDYYPAGKRWWVRLHEKGGKQHEMPAHHKLEQFLDEYLAAAGIREDGNTPLFRSTIGRTGRLTENAMDRVDAYSMIRRRTAEAGFKIKLGCHVFRATGITAYLEAGGTLEKAQAMAAHESPRTTKLYDRRSDEITLDEIERITI